MTGTKYALAVEYRSALSVRRPGRRTSILMINAKYGFDFRPRPSVLGNRRLLVRSTIRGGGRTEKGNRPRRNEGRQSGRSLGETFDPCLPNALTRRLGETPATDPEDKITLSLPLYRNVAVSANIYIADLRPKRLRLRPIFVVYQMRTEKGRAESITKLIRVMQ